MTQQQAPKIDITLLSSLTGLGEKGRFKEGSWKERDQNGEHRQGASKIINKDEKSRKGGKKAKRQDEISKGKTRR